MNRRSFLLRHAVSVLFFGLPAKPATSTVSRPSALLAARQTPSTPASDGRGEQILQTLDTNNNGKIAGDEAKSEPGQRFLRMFDRNGDGVVTIDEARGQSSPSPSADRAQPRPPARAAKSKSSRPTQDPILPPPWIDPDKTEPAGTKYQTFRSRTIGGDVSYLIYLPPGYERETTRHYPALYWLHGGGGNQRVGAYFVELVDRAIRANQAPPMIVVLVNGLGSSLFNDSSDGKRPVESVIIKDLIPHVDATYRTLADRSGRGVEGFSMGGYGAAHLGFKFPELFGVVSNLAGAVIDVEFFASYQDGRILKDVFSGGREAFHRNHPFTLAEKNADAIRGRTHVRILVGDQDTGRGTLDANRKFHQLLDRVGIRHDYREVPGVRHNYRAVYDTVGEDAFEFYRIAFGTRAGTVAAIDAGPAPPVCYDISQPFPGEIPQYRVSRESKPVEPFEILDGLFYVGNTQVSAHLLTTTNGLVLMDSTMPHQVQWLLKSIRKLGFNPRDVKVVIGNHAHLDHIGGHWYFQHYFGAQTWLHEADAAAAETSAWKPGKPVVLDGTLKTISSAFPAFKTDRKLRDGETIEWGGRKLTFYLAAGHTPGTLFTQFPLRDKSSNQIVTAGMLGGFGMGRPGFAETVAKLRGMDVQLVLGAHPNQNQTFDKQRRLQTGAQPNPFIDPTGWAQFLDRLGALAERMRSPTSSKK